MWDSPTAIDIHKPYHDWGWLISTIYRTHKHMMIVVMTWGLSNWLQTWVYHGLPHAFPCYTAHKHMVMTWGWLISAPPNDSTEMSLPTCRWRVQIWSEFLRPVAKASPLNVRMGTYGKTWETWNLISQWIIEFFHICLTCLTIKQRGDMVNFINVSLSLGRWSIHGNWTKLDHGTVGNHGFWVGWVGHLEQGLMTSY